MKKESRLHAKAVPFVLLLLCLLAFGEVVPAQDKAAKLDELMKAYHANGNFNGVVLVAENGKVVYKKGFGMANMEWAIPNEPDTRFRLGSITKQFTSMLVLQLAEAGKLKLDGKVTEYLPDYRKDTGERVTIHHLLTHTSGIPSYTGQPRFFEDVSRTPYAVADFVKKYASGDLEFEPGSKFAYNNSGYFLLGAIIERVTGKPYEQVLRERILDPVGMKNTGYDHHNTIIAKRAAGYNKTPTGFENAPYLDMSLPYAAGSMYSTVEDLYLWDQALYTDRLLSAKMRELMFKPFLQNYAYGWGIAQAPFGEGGAPVSIVTHTGGINGFSTIIVRMVEQKNMIVLLSNVGTPRLEAISTGLARALYGQPYELPRRSIAEAMIKTVVERDVQTAIKQYREWKGSPQQSALYDWSEEELNTLGYQLLGMRRLADAIEIFKLNTEAFPRAFNPYDSLGEAYMMNGNKELSIQNYKKSLELNPQNTNAVEKLKLLNEK